MSDVIRVITTCTSRKLSPPATGATVPLPGLERGEGQVPAKRLYTGEQHRRLMAGIRELAPVMPVELWVISAKAGLISGEERLAPYDESFAGMPAPRLRALAGELEIPQQFRARVAESAALTVVLAGSDYYDAAALERPTAWGSPTLLLTSTSRAVRAPRHPQLRPLAVSQAHAKRWSLPLTLLKGELVGRMLATLARGQTTPSALFDSVESQLLEPPGYLVAC